MTLKTTLLAGERIIGCFASIPHPVAIEVCAAQQLDVLCIDAEHSQIDRERIEDLVRACDAGRVAAMVRVPGNQPEWIATALDAGAEAILVPRVSSAREARAAASYGRYPPAGIRGAGPGRASRYGYAIGPYLAAANDRLLMAVQIETAEGLACVDEIAAVDGIDMLFVGPFDLALSIGAVGPAGAAKLDQAIERVAEAAKRSGKALGIFRQNADDVGRWAHAGYRFFLVGSDTLFIGGAAATMLAAARVSGDAA